MEDCRVALPYKDKLLAMTVFFIPVCQSLGFLTEYRFYSGYAYSIRNTKYARRVPSHGHFLTKNGEFSLHSADRWYNKYKKNTVVRIQKTTNNKNGGICKSYVGFNKLELLAPCFSWGWPRGIRQLS